MSSRTVVLSALAATPIAALLLAASAGEPPRRQLLAERFESRPVSQVEIGDFHFLPGQIAPVHTHAAPVFGFVSKGSIYYQVEGRDPVVLKTGEAFYEPVGPKILHFDNASKTEEAVFTDLNFEREGEPFIVFPTPPTEKIDRRSFPAARLAVAKADTMNVFEESLAPAARLPLPAAGETIAAFVADGAVAVKIGRETPVVYSAGQTFYAPSRMAGDEIVNASNTTTARVVTFHLSSSH